VIETASAAASTPWQSLALRQLSPALGRGLIAADIVLSTFSSCGECVMAKLRHIAIQVPDLEKAATFYEGVFGLKRLKKVEAPIGNAISLTDGVMNLTLLHFPAGTNGGKGGPDWAGLHHFGFIVDSEDATEAEIKKHGGEFFMKLPQYPGVDAEKKFKDPNGIVFDVTEHGWGPTV
jgi:catechol 2,3-dioxygenase-like lactoylglutathione lyase family enzyme